MRRRTTCCTDVTFCSQHDRMKSLAFQLAQYLYRQTRGNLTMHTTARTMYHHIYASSSINSCTQRTVHQRSFSVNIATTILYLLQLM
jgi:hypothetical protein